MSDALQNFADSLIAMNAGQSGQVGGQAQFLKNIQARGMKAEEDRKNELIKTNIMGALKDKHPDMPEEMLQLYSYFPSAAVARLNQKTDYPTSYDEYVLTTKNPTREGYLNFLNRNKPKPKRDSFVAKDGYRYFTDNQERVFPNVEVKEEQTQEDIFKENAARIKNMVVNEGENSPNLTDFEKNFYKTYIKPRSGNIVDQLIAAQLGFGNNEISTPPPTSYEIINDAYKNVSVDSIINTAMSLNNKVSREQAIQELIAAGIIAPE